MLHSPMLHSPMLLLLLLLLAEPEGQLLPAAVPAAGGWAQLLTSARSCVDAHGGGAVIDTYVQLRRSVVRRRCGERAVRSRSQRVAEPSHARGMRDGGSLRGACGWQPVPG